MKQSPIAISSVDECGVVVKTRNKTTGRINKKKSHNTHKWVPKSVKLRNKIAGRSYLRTEETANGDRNEEFYEREYEEWEAKMLELDAYFDMYNYMLDYSYDTSHDPSCTCEFCWEVSYFDY